MAKPTSVFRRMDTKLLKCLAGASWGVGGGSALARLGRVCTADTIRNSRRLSISTLLVLTIYIYGVYNYTSIHVVLIKIHLLKSNHGLPRI
jgi:hypothetical protein